MKDYDFSIQDFVQRYPLQSWLSTVLRDFGNEPLFQYKNDVPTHHFHKCQLYIYSFCHQFILLEDVQNEIGIEVYFTLHNVGEFCGWGLWRCKGSLCKDYWMLHPR